MNEILFEITQDADGGFSAECLTESIFTQGDNWEELRANLKEAVDAFYFDRELIPKFTLIFPANRSAVTGASKTPFR